MQLDVLRVYIQVSLLALSFAITSHATDRRLGVVENRLGGPLGSHLLGVKLGAERRIFI